MPTLFLNNNTRCNLKINTTIISSQDFISKKKITIFLSTILNNSNIKKGSNNNFNKKGLEEEAIDPNDFNKIYFRI